VNKFTPGKWDVSAKRKNLVIGPRGHALADCKFSHSATNRQLPTESECIANARLIAAAPDLLALLKEWDEPGACGCDTATCRGTCLPARTRDAIAKATGERS